MLYNYSYILKCLFHKRNKAEKLLWDYRVTQQVSDLGLVEFDFTCFKERAKQPCRMSGTYKSKPAKPRSVTGKVNLEFSGGKSKIWLLKGY